MLKYIKFSVITLAILLSSKIYSAIEVNNESGISVFAILNHQECEEYCAKKLVSPGERITLRNTKAKNKKNGFRLSIISLRGNKLIDVADLDIKQSSQATLTRNRFIYKDSKNKIHSIAWELPKEKELPPALELKELPNPLQ